MAQRIYIQLGRLGDLINLLPILHDDAQQGRRAAIMVCKEYAPLFSGCSYCDVIEFDGSMWNVDAAVKQAQAISDDVKCCQVLGDTDVVLRNTYAPAGQKHAVSDSFQKEAYQVLGRLDLWRKQSKPVFDKRNHVREQAFLNSLPVNPKGAILVAVNGNSSPFQSDELLFEILRLEFPKVPIIDLSTVRAEQFYDLLAVFEVGHCLIAADSAPLHLAFAVNIPVVALIADKPSLWHGSSWRTGHIAHIRYNDFANRAMDAIRAIKNIGGPGCPFQKHVKSPKIVHVWSGYELTQENRPRHDVARSTWELEYLSEHWISSPHELGATGFDSKRDPLLKDKDKVPFPYLKQVIRTAAMRSNDDDIICLTRCDAAFAIEGITDQLLKHPVCYAHRTIRDEDGDTWHPIVDLFAFTKKWWREHQSECPELILGHDHWWNRVFLTLIKHHGGVELPFAVYRAASEVKSTGEAKPRELHNENLHKKWQDNFGPITLYPPISRQLPAAIINRHALSPFGYNGSIVRWNNRLLLGYRWHNQNDYSTALAIADIDEAGNVKSNKLISIPHQGGSEEDCRLFTAGKELFMSYVDSNYPSMPAKSVMRYGKLTEDTQWALQDIQQPVYGENHGNGMEKNWVLFPWEGRLLCIYQTAPETILLELKGSAATEIVRFTGPRWPWGTIRGGTPPLPFKGKLLRFFHSGLDNECPPYRRRYYVGALVTEPALPFKVLSVSREPVLRGSELDDLSATERSSILHHKAKVIFPMGAIPNKDGWLLSCGVNDSHCALFSVTERDLKL